MLGHVALEAQDVDLRHRAGGQQRPRLCQFLLRQFEAALGRGAARLHLDKLLLALRQLLAVDRQLGRQLRQAQLVELALAFDGALLLVAACGRWLERAVGCQRTQARRARAQRHALHLALAQPGSGAGLIDAQQELAGLDHLALLDQDLDHHATIQRLHDLQLPR